jgi:hypothetical protein
VVRDPTLAGDGPPVDYFAIIFATKYLAHVCRAAKGFGIFQCEYNPMWKMTDAELRQVICCELSKETTPGTDRVQLLPHRHAFPHCLGARECAGSSCRPA